MVVENQARQLQRWPSDEPDGDTVAPTTPPVQQSAKVQNTSKNRALLWGGKCYRTCFCTRQLL